MRNEWRMDATEYVPKQLPCRSDYFERQHFHRYMLAINAAGGLSDYRSRNSDVLFQLKRL